MQSSSLASGGSGAEEGGQSNAAPQAAGVGNIAASDENNGHIGTEDMGGGTSFPSSSAAAAAGSMVASKKEPPPLSPKIDDDLCSPPPQKKRSLDAVNKKGTPVIKNKKKLYLYIFLRESPKEKKEMLKYGYISQLRRNLSAALVYCKRHGYKLILRNVYYAEEVKRQKTGQCKTLVALMRDLIDFKREEGSIVSPKIWLMTTELLRFGSNAYAVQYVLDAINRVVVNDVRVMIMTLKEAFLDVSAQKNLAAHFNDKTEEEEAQAEIATQVDPAKSIPVAADDVDEREIIHARAEVIYTAIDQNNGSLPKEFDDWISFKSPSQMTPSQVQRKQLVKAQCDILGISCDKKQALNGGWHELREIDVIDINEQNVKRYGEEFMKSLLETTVSSGTAPRRNSRVGCYFRTSESTTSREIYLTSATNEKILVPMHQLSVLLAALERQYKTGGSRITATIFYDRFKKRECLCNPLLYSFCSGICNGDYDCVMAYKTNRFNSYQVTFHLVDYFCTRTTTKLDIPFHHGQDYKLVAKAETDRRLQQNHVYAKYVDQLKLLRNNLPSHEREMALAFLTVGKQHDNQDDKEMLKDIVDTNEFDKSMFAKAYVVKNDV